MALTPEQRTQYIATIRDFPATLEALVSDLTAEQLTTHYQQGEWTIAQNVHHVADSHMNSYIRLKLMLTETHPPLKGYDEGAWAQLPDATVADISATMSLLRGLHTRWVHVFEQLQDDQWQRVGVHSEIGEVTVDDLVRIYAGHCNAHIDQIKQVLAAQ